MFSFNNAINLVENDKENNKVSIDEANKYANNIIEHYTNN